LGLTRRRAGRVQHDLADPGADRVDRDRDRAGRVTVDVARADHEELQPFERGLLAARDQRADDLAEDHGGSYFLPPPVAAGPGGMTASPLACGRGITWTDTTSPTRSAARWPASVAALTAATSPRTIAVTYPPPIFSNPTSSTLAALTIASAASTMPTKPLVSIIPRASAISSPVNAL